MPPRLPGFDRVPRRSRTEVRTRDREHEHDCEHEPAATFAPAHAQFFGGEKEIGIAGHLLSIKQKAAKDAKVRILPLRTHLWTLSPQQTRHVCRNLLQPTATGHRSNRERV